MLTNKLKFGIKNFYTEIGLSKHFTLKGYMRRLQRTYPRMYMTTKFTIIFGLLSSSIEILVPGTSLPFQKVIKYKMLNM